jgi:hypothetical protein
MPDILDDLADVLDPEQLAAVRARVGETDSTLARTQRDLALLRNPQTLTDYPRAAQALKLGVIDLGDAVTPEAVSERMKAEEAKLEALGVPVSAAPAAAPAPATSDDPTAALASLQRGVAPPVARDLPREYIEAVGGTTEQDRERAAVILLEMNNLGMKEEISALSERLGGRPIIPLGI